MKGLGSNLNLGLTDEWPKGPLNWPWLQPLVMEVLLVKVGSNHVFI
jgi:hypothetical protein